MRELRYADGNRGAHFGGEGAHVDLFASMGQMHFVLVGHHYPHIGQLQGEGADIARKHRPGDTRDIVGDAIHVFSPFVLRQFAILEQFDGHRLGGDVFADAGVLQLHAVIDVQPH